MIPCLKTFRVNTRAIIDYTEIKCQMPSSLLLNSELFSSYKNHTTLKCLIAISPAGHISFISQLYTGSISDRNYREKWIPQYKTSGSCL